MSWSGTVTCSHCYRQGHNKRKCEVLTERTLRNYNDNVGWAAAIGEGDPDYYLRQAERYRLEYMKRTKIDPASGEKVKNKTAKAERMKKVNCGYCGDAGHTRRVCEVVKRDKLVFIEESRRARAAAFEDAVNMGIGEGSMIPIRTNGYNSDNKWGAYTSLRYVKEIDWDAVTSARPTLWVYHVEAGKLGSANQSRWTSRDQIRGMQENFNEARAYATTMSQPVPSASLIPSLDVPAGWMDCEPSTIDVAVHFPTKGNKYHKQRAHLYAWPSKDTKQAIIDLGLEEHWKGRL